MKANIPEETNVTVTNWCYSDGAIKVNCASPADNIPKRRRGQKE